MGSLIICFLLIAVALLLMRMIGILIFVAGKVNRGVSLRDFFFQTLTGLCAVVFLYAVFKSAAHTTMLLLFIPGFMLWKQRATPASGFSWKELLPQSKHLFLLLVSCGVVAPLLFYCYETYTLQEDSYNYLKIAESLRWTGIENTRHFRSVYSPDFNGIEPYHYFEMWLGALFMDITNAVPDLILFRVVSYGIIMSLVLVGLTAVFELKNVRNSLATAFGCSVLFLFFIPNVAQLFIDYEKHFAYDAISNPLVRLNFRTYWLFLLPFILLVQNKNYFQALLSLLVLPVISFTTSPAICGGIMLVILTNRWTKVLDRKQCFRLFIVLASFGVALLLVLFVFRMKNVQSLYAYSGGYIMNYYKTAWKAIIGAILKEFLNIILVFSPYLLLIVLAGKGKVWTKNWLASNKVYFVMVAATVLSGTLLFQVASFMNNSYQFAYITYCLIALCIPPLWKAAYESSSGTRRIAVSLSLVALVAFGAVRFNELNRNSIFNGVSAYNNYQKYSPAYIAEIKTRITDDNIVGAYIGDSAYYDHKYYSKRLPDFYFPGSAYYIASFSDNGYQYCLSDTTAIQYGYNGTQRDFEFLRRATASSLFHMKYFATRGSSDVTDNSWIGMKRAAAIAEFGITYVVLAPGVQPDAEWAKQVKAISVDGNTGESIAWLQ